MKLVVPSKTLPEHKPGWKVWGTTKKNELVGLGEYARLSIGQRLFGTYAQFYHIDMRPQQFSFSCDARSANGELYFKVQFDGTCISDNDRISELLHISDPLDAFVVKELTLQAQDLSESFDAEDDRIFQRQLQELLNPRHGPAFETGPMVLQRVRVTVHLPTELKARGEIEAVMRDLPAKIVLAVSRGESEKAGLLQSAHETWQKFKTINNDGTLDAASQSLI